MRALSTVVVVVFSNIEWIYNCKPCLCVCVHGERAEVKHVHVFFVSLLPSHLLIFHSSLQKVFV